MEEKPTAAFVLSLIGGILWLLIGVAISAIGGALTWFIGGIGAIFGFYWIITGLIITIGAFMMNNQPSSTHTWGIVILILSIISVNIFGLIGGILALVWKPRATSAAPPPPP